MSSWFELLLCANVIDPESAAIKAAQAKERSTWRKRVCIGRENIRSSTLFRHDIVVLRPKKEKSKSVHVGCGPRA
jgi:hypothetical protein